MIFDNKKSTDKRLWIFFTAVPGLLALGLS